MNAWVCGADTELVVSPVQGVVLEPRSGVFTRRALPPERRGRRSPFAPADPAAFNDAFETMSDNDTGFRCVTTPLDPGLR